MNESELSGAARSDAAPPPHDAARHPLPSELLHDLRTPLNHIIGYSELLMEQARKQGHTGYLPQLQKVSAAGYRLLALMDENFHSDPPPQPEQPLATAGEGDVETNRDLHSDRSLEKSRDEKHQ